MTVVCFFGRNSKKCEELPSEVRRDTYSLSALLNDNIFYFWEEFLLVTVIQHAKMQLHVFFLFLTVAIWPHVLCGRNILSSV